MKFEVEFDDAAAFPEWIYDFGNRGERRKNRFTGF